MKLHAMILILMGAALAGCANRPGPPTPKPQIAYGCPVGSQSVGKMDDLVSAKVQTAGQVPNIKVQAMRCIMQGDLLRIDFTLANSAPTVRHIAYRFDWIDRNGMKAWNDEVWKPVYMYEQSSETIVGTAPAATAVDFRLVLLDEDKQR